VQFASIVDISDWRVQGDPRRPGGLPHNFRPGQLFDEDRYQNAGYDQACSQNIAGVRLLA
jgi:hypothetical protein